MTEGCWTILAILLLESVFGSLLILETPQWLFAAAFAHGFVPWWMSGVTLINGMLLGALLQPYFLVGFARCMCVVRMILSYSRPLPKSATDHL